ncbi:hypothetical protein ACVWYG_000472 [Pedobacter sp. UYEF25]
MEKTYPQYLSQITAHKKALHSTHLVRKVATNLDAFAKYSIGQQFIKAVVLFQLIVPTILAGIIKKIK